MSVAARPKPPALPRTGTTPAPERAGLAVVVVAPGALMGVLAFVSGGFFPDATAVAAIVVLLCLVVRVTTARTPFAGRSAGLGVAASALVALAIWTLLSGGWSHAPAAALLEYNRTLLYAALLVFGGIVARSPARARGVLYVLAAVSAAVSVAALAVWLAPDVFVAGGDLARDRQGWPTTYWNATGLIAGFAVIWAAALTCGSRERPWIRVAAAVVAPLAAAALIFTVSRGALAVTLLGVAVALAAMRSRAAVGGMTALAAGVGAAALVALGVDGLNTHAPTADALAAGRHAAAALLVIAVATGALRALLLRVDRRLAVASLPAVPPRRRAVVAATAAAVLAATFLAAGGPSAVHRAADEFVAPESVDAALPASTRLTRLGNNGRIEQWRVALRDGFAAAPLHGAGAGTYAALWTEHTHSSRRVLDAHSLYVEQLAELGVVGAALVVVAIGAILAALARRVHDGEREVWAALLAAAVAWAIHAGVDWDWEMPAVTAWVFVVGGMALAAPPRRDAPEARRDVRLAVGLGCLLLAVAPALVWRSQTQLTTAVKALQRGDCVTAANAALASQAAVGSRPEPFEIISYCEAGSGRYAAALQAVQAAERRAPQSWELRYSEALIRGAAGDDPRPAARTALRLYPAFDLTRRAVRGFAGHDPRRWRAFALAAPLPLPGAR